MIVINSALFSPYSAHCFPEASATALSTQHSFPYSEHRRAEAS
uniref:Uncharacterized protein n=1 Tax=Desertifilum tharense IPPAS B-1220 TaxID=1781255 RepID=A0ACD5GXF6_9CYAN